MIGLQRGIVKLSAYEKGWMALYEGEKRSLLNTIGHLSVAIEHVGSTSIPGAFAKPVIDIAVGVETLSVGVLCVPPLAEIGYSYKGEAGVPDRHFFVKGSERCRTTYLHIEQLNGVNWKNHILFRDYLRDHSDVAMEYSTLKQTLAARYPKDRDAYAKAKDPFIEKILGIAADTYVFDGHGKTRLIQR